MKPTARDLYVVCLALEADILSFEPYFRELKEESARTALENTKQSFARVLNFLLEEGKKLSEI